jgi:D-alanyl-D-alanine carboxypeptidase
MSCVRSEARYGLRSCVSSLAAVLAVLAITSGAADARHHRRGHYVHYAHHKRHHHRSRAEAYSPPTSSILVDGNTGEVLEQSNPDALRHPASLTKIMTLYLLFERLESGKMKLDTPLKVSEHASEQAPTKLGVKPGQTIAVEDAIKAVVTRSANDVAVVIAENLGGSEDDFCKIMTQKARALGMSHTTYVNASGLPDDDQITTARDQALLGRAIQEHFPHYYKYFSTSSFVYHGESIRNHNHLLGSMDGVDGIKTGFTRASGFNLVTSVHRDGRFIVGVVLGGRSAFARDAHMRELINSHIKMASLRHTAPVIAERNNEPQQVAFAKAPMTSRADPTSTASVASAAKAGESDPIRPLLVHTITYRTAPVRTASLGPMPALVPVAAAAPQAAPQRQAGRSQPPSLSSEAPHTIMASAEPIAPAAMAPAAGPSKAEAARSEPVRPEPAKIENTKTEIAKAEVANSIPSTPAHIRGGWLIQIGAYDGVDEARQHLSEARTKVHTALAAADPFTEKVQKGDKALYRARFAGFDKATAEAACKQLKRSDFDCMAVKN